MSIYQKASLVQIPSGYKASTDKLYSVVPNNGDGDFTVSVDADATRVNKDGLIESVVADQARLNYDPSNPQDPHLLLEPSRTNYLTNSNDASLWAASQSNGTVTTTQNYSTAPNGSNEATRLEASVSGSGYALLSKSTTSFFGDYAATVYLKSTNGTSQNVCIYGRNTGNQVVTVTNEWQRFEINGSSTSGQSNFINLGVNTGFTGEDNPIDILVWGGQIEEGNYATSLIPTTGAVTRTADDAYQTTTFDLSTNNEYSFYIDVEGTNFTSDLQYLLKIQDRSNGYGFKLQAYTFSGNEYVRMFANYGGGSQATITPYGNTEIPFYDRNRIAVSLRSDGYSTYLNGVKLTNQSASTSVNWDSVNDVDFNSTSSGSNVYGRKTYELMVFNTALSDSELQTLTS